MSGHLLSSEFLISNITGILSKRKILTRDVGIVLSNTYITCSSLLASPVHSTRKTFFVSNSVLLFEKKKKKNLASLLSQPTSLLRRKMGPRKWSWNIRLFYYLFERIYFLHRVRDFSSLRLDSNQYVWYPIREGCFSEISKGCQNTHLSRLGKSPFSYSKNFGSSPTVTTPV